MIKIKKMKLIDFKKKNETVYVYYFSNSDVKLEILFAISKKDVFIKYEFKSNKIFKNINKLYKDCNDFFEREYDVSLYEKNNQFFKERKDTFFARKLFGMRNEKKIVVFNFFLKEEDLSFSVEDEWMHYYLQKKYSEILQKNKSTKELIDKHWALLYKADVNNPTFLEGVLSDKSLNVEEKKELLELNYDF